MNESGQKHPIRTWSRASTVFPEMVGHTIAVHDGRKHVPIFVTGAWRAQARRVRFRRGSSAAIPATGRSRRVVATVETRAPTEVRAQARYVRTAPRKAQLVAEQIRGRTVPEARTILTFATRPRTSRASSSPRSRTPANRGLSGDELCSAVRRRRTVLKRWRARAEAESPGSRSAPATSPCASRDARPCRDPAHAGRAAARADRGSGPGPEAEAESPPPRRRRPSPSRSGLRARRPPRRPRPTLRRWRSRSGGAQRRRPPRPRRRSGRRPP